MAANNVFAGRYRLDRLLGEGGFKVVWQAHDLLLRRDVALALYRLAADQGAVRAELLREARALARLSDHPRIVTVFDAGEHGGVAYLTMRLMTGGDLAALLDAQPGRRLDRRRAVALAADILDALAAAHAERVIHRDVKPTNIWLDREGRAVLGDFGIAAGGAAGHSASLVDASGTLPYMAPDPFQGERAGPGSDLYSVGCTLYELLTGRPPFIGEPAAIVAQHLSASPPPPSRIVPSLPPALDAAVLRLLAKRPSDRPASAEDAKRLLRESDRAPSRAPADGVHRAARPVSHEPTVQTGRSEAAPPTTDTKGRSVFWAAVAGLAAVTITAIALMAFAGDGGRSATTTPVARAPGRTPMPAPTQTPQPTPQPVAGQTFVVNSMPVGCHAGPDVGAAVIADRPPGAIQAMDMVIRLPDGTWHHEVDQQCWTRTDPGPVRIFGNLEAAEQYVRTLRSTPTPPPLTPPPSPSPAPVWLVVGGLPDDDCACVRERPGLNGAPIDCLPNGAAVQRLQESQSLDGIQWWRVNLGGWMADVYLRQGVGTFQPPAGSPTEAVRAFYTYLGQRRWGHAYQLFSANRKRREPYGTWVAGYAATEQVTVEAVEDGPSPGSVNVRLRSVDRRPDGLVTRAWAGPWRLVQESGAWRLDSDSVREASPNTPSPTPVPTPPPTPSPARTRTATPTSTVSESECVRLMPWRVNPGAFSDEVVGELRNDCPVGVCLRFTGVAYRDAAGQVIAVANRLQGVGLPLRAGASGVFRFTTSVPSSRGTQAELLREIAASRDSEPPLCF